MKLEQSSEAKLEYWARNRTVVPLPRIANLPKIASRKFDSYEEFNAWKKSLLLQLAAQGVAQWKP